MAAEAAGLDSWVTPHTLRHSFAKRPFAGPKAVLA
jgi:site-specific recombinase XerD